MDYQILGSRLCWCFSPAKTLLVKQSVKCEETFTLRLLVNVCALAESHNNGKRGNPTKRVDKLDFLDYGILDLGGVGKWFESSQTPGRQNFGMVFKIIQEWN